MKLHSYLLAALLAVASVASAQRRVVADNEGLLGYTNSSHPDSITVSNGGFGAAGTYTIGAWLTSDQLANYVGCKVLGMRFAVGQSIGNTTVYLYKSVGDNTETIAQKNVRSTAAGWNEVRFNSDDVYTITGEEGLIYLFDYKETADMVAADDGAICAYGSTSSSVNASIYYNGTKFASLSGIGNLCVQLILDLTVLPQKNVTGTMLMVGNKYKKPGDAIDAFLQYSNTGQQDISSVRWGYQVDNGKATFLTNTTALAKGSSESIEAEFDLPKDLTAGSHDLKFFVDQIDGVAPVKADTVVSTIIAFNDSLPRQQTLIEQFTDPGTYYASLIDPQLQKLEGKDSVTIVNYHRQDSPLAVADAAPLEAIYAYTYPCHMFNRFYMFGENYVAFDVNDYLLLLPTILYDSAVEQIAEARQQPAFATISLQPTYNADTRELQLAVSGDVSADAAAIFGDLALHVLLTEDGVVSPQVTYNSKTGRTTTTENYKHNEVMRTFVSSANGDKLTVTDGRYTATYTTKLADGWQPANMKAVAFVTRYADEVTDDNVLDMDVTNATSVNLSTIISGIETTTAEAAHSAAEYYTLNGTRVIAAQLHTGLYLVRQNGQTRKVVIR